MGLGALPGSDPYSQAFDVSADGSVVVGVSNAINGSGQRYGDFFRWTRETGLVGLGAEGIHELSVSSDGSTIVGTYGTGWRWHINTGVQSLPLRSVRSVSGDGSIVVGWGVATIENDVGAVWTDGGGVQRVHAELVPSQLWDISADGQVMLGRGGLGEFLWTAEQGVRYLDCVDGGPDDQLSDDGRAVLIDRYGAPVRWTESGVVEIGPLPDGRQTISGRGISADGSIIVGNSESFPGLTPSQKGYIWDAGHGARYVEDVLRDEYGLGNQFAGWTLGVARGVSGDGRSIIGRGLNPAGQEEAWIAHLGSAASADFDGDGSVDGADFLTWQRGVGTHPAEHADGDANGDSMVDASDLQAWRHEFGTSTMITTAVPDPAAHLLLAEAAHCALGAGFVRRRLRQYRRSGSNSPL